MSIVAAIIMGFLGALFAAGFGRSLTESNDSFQQMSMMIISVVLLLASHLTLFFR